MYGSGDGTGQYSTLADCQLNCISPAPISYNCQSGNCVDPGDGSGTYSTLAACQAVCTVSPKPEVTSVSGYMEPCIGGTLDDHMGASVTLDSPVSVDTTFDVRIGYTDLNGSCNNPLYLQNITVEILAGDFSSNFIACNNGVYLPSGALICQACISSCSNPDVDVTSFSC